MRDRTLLEIFQFIDFSFIGMTTFAVHAFLTVLLTEVAGLAYYLSYAVSLVVGWLLNFLLNMRLTFRVKGGVSGMLERYFAAMIALAVANWLLVLALVEKLGMHYLLSIVLATVLLSMANFMMQKLWVFGRKPARR